MAKFANIRPEQINKARRMLQDLPKRQNARRDRKRLFCWEVTCVKH